ncbi:MAG: hypothetical protein M3R46_08435 [Actinomycetota bacterium]|nr:hypothetical protein [Actinomycetota bacterium]
MQKVAKTAYVGLRTYGEPELGGDAPLERWDVTTWAVGLARLLNGFSALSEWDSRDPTPAHHLGILDGPSDRRGAGWRLAP